MPQENAGSRNSRIGSVGSAARSSHRMNATSRSAAATSAPSTSPLCQPTVLPRTRPHTSPSAAPRHQQHAAEVETPAWPKAFFDCARIIGNPRGRIGTFSQKIHCQARPSGDRAAHHRAGQHRQHGQAAEGTERPRPLLRRESVTQLRHSQRHHQRRAAALNGARRDQPAHRGRERTRGRRGREQRQAGHKTCACDPKRSPSAAPVMSSTAKLRL